MIENTDYCDDAVFDELELENRALSFLEQSGYEIGMSNVEAVAFMVEKHFSYSDIGKLIDRLKEYQSPEADALVEQREAAEAAY